MTYPGGHKYDEDWKDVGNDSSVKVTGSDGRKYTGIFRDGKPYGQGTYTNLDGTKNLGKWAVTEDNIIWKTKFDDSQSKEISTLYQWKTSSGMERVPIGADERQPNYEGEIINKDPNGIGALT